MFTLQKDIRLIGSNFGKAIDRLWNIFIYDGKVQYLTV